MAAALATVAPLNRLGLGLAALGRPGYLTLGHARDLPDTAVASMEQRCHEVLDAAWARGVRYVDAARSYGRAEEFLSSWLVSRALPREALTVASKWGYTYTAGWRTQAEQHEIKDHSPAALLRQLGESRALLGRWLAVYQIHSVTEESPALADRALLDELARLRDGGLRIGLSVSGPRQAEVIARAVSLHASGARLFDVVQATWNLHETSCGPALAEAHAAGITVVVKEPMANGRLARQPPPALALVARSLQATPDAVALAAVLAQPWASVALSGAATVLQVEQNAAACNLTLDSGILQALQPLAEQPADYWRTRAALAWT